MSHRANRDKRVTVEFTNQVFAGLERVGASGCRMVVAVSGGPDSTALLVALDSLRRQRAFEILAAHANHMLRGDESERDEQFLVDLCAGLGVELVCRPIPVPLDAMAREDSIESTARDRRLQFLADVASEQGARFVATAHTADDQAETVLHRIVRGTGLAGLAGIPATRLLVPGVTLIRPMLHLRRHQVHAYLSSIDQKSREDSSNRDLRFTRNRLRHEVLPYLAKQMNPQIVDALVRLASLAGDAQSVLDDQTGRLMRRARIRRDPHRVEWNVNVLRRAPRYVLREAFRRLWSEQSWPQQELGYADLARVADLVQGPQQTDACHLPGGIVVRRINSRIIIADGSRTPAKKGR